MERRPDRAADGVGQDEVAFTIQLSYAADVKSLSTAQRFHQHLISTLYCREECGTLSAVLVHRYAQCGDLKNAVSVFEPGSTDGLRFDLNGWNCPLSARKEYGEPRTRMPTGQRYLACFTGAAQQLFDQLRNQSPDLDAHQSS